MDNYQMNVEEREQRFRDYCEDVEEELRARNDPFIYVGDDSNDSPPLPLLLMRMMEERNFEEDEEDEDEWDSGFDSDEEEEEEGLIFI